MVSTPDPLSDAHADGIADDLRDAQQLARKVRTGDVVAFEALYKLFWTAMYNFAFRYVQSADEAEDVVQEVFFRIWRTRAEWNVVGSVQNYLFVAVRNSAIGRLRRNASAHKWQERERPELADGTSLALDESLVTAERHADIERALAEMPEKRRVVCTLRWIDDMSYAEISARLGITEKTVENHIGNGLKFMRERLSSK